MAVEICFGLSKGILSLSKVVGISALKGSHHDLRVALNTVCKRQQQCDDKWTASDCKYLLESLSCGLLEPQLTLQICVRFRPILLQLLYGAADVASGNGFSHQRFCVALSKIVYVYPQCITFAVGYLNSHSPFVGHSSSSCEPPARKKCKKVKDEAKISNLEICKACYLLLLSDPERFCSLYDWSVLLKYFNSDCETTKWYSIQASCIATSTSALNKKKLLDTHFTQTRQSQLYIEQLELERELKDTAQSVTDDECALVLQSGGEANSACVLTTADLHPSLTAVCGIVLAKSTTGAQASLQSPVAVDGGNSMVVVSSTSAALQHVAMAVSCEQPIILSGHIGAGKTSLIEYLARLTGRYDELIKVQLGEQIDSRALIGTYCCTETPGQFVWRAGPLTTAVQQGKWLLLEDIDIAPMDVVSSLLSLVETGKLQSSNNCSDNKAKPGFQLFMTKRLQNAGVSSQYNCSLLEKAVTTVNIQPLSRTELTTIVNALHPNLSMVTDRLLDMYFTLSSGQHSDDRIDVTDTELMKLNSYFGSRKLSTRDLLRWCARISGDFQLESSHNEISVFQEALDCFCDSLTKPSQRLRLAEAIGTKINVSAEKAQYYSTVYKPTIEMSKDMMKVGRASLARKSVSAVDSLSRETGSKFAFTRQSSALLEKIGVCISHGEPVLLVGETGTGKTSVVQYLAQQTGRKLRVINMNQQSDTTDLLGGYKPVMISRIISPLRDEFELIFCQTFSRKQNQKFLSHIQHCFSTKSWTDLLRLIEHTVKAALSKSSNLEKWKQLQKQLETVKLQVKYAESALAFSFVEGALVKALKNGDWVLLDEINLATAETLDCLCGLLDTCQGSVTLVDRGDTSPVARHPEFRLFACMNPATDVGKRDLTAGVRSRFTEFFVDELESKPDLRVMVSAYLSGLSLEPKQIDGIVSFYLAIKQEASAKLTDGTGKRPTYSLRTLCRALRYAASNPYHAVQRSLYEAFSMSFLTQVDRSSHPAVTKLIVQHIIGKAKVKALLSKPLLPPPDVPCEKFEGYWLKKGQHEPIKDENYVLTETVKANMRDVARVVACGRHPVLLQGETSVGKTSMIEYIAKASGNRCVRINNHEHTDVQEYTGSYVADEHGHLVFKEGILVDAMRHGYWIILDELNLAPTDVLEALNRLLDDNRELFIAETQQTVKAHPGFILFATQNPPGLYGGRKMLSRAFRNRFVELHFDEIPHEELEYILHKRCALPKSSSKKMIKVMSELQVRRRDSGLFAGKQGYITLRDVFRWGERYRLSAAEITDTFYNWDQLLADQGFMLLAGRVRKAEEEQVIAEVLQKHFKCAVDPLAIFSSTSTYAKESQAQIAREDTSSLFQHIVWTYSLTRLSVLVGQAIKFNEPVLMIGDTGCGKTTICQYFAHVHQRELHTVNCHMHTEGSHFLGGLRPVRHSQMQTDEDGAGGKLFEWQDGPLVISMRTGSVLLVDEISLADDSVLERLNSVLEPSRTLVLAEKGGELEIIKADPSFRIVATMNPSGDYGKKELSPALRNRFTEIWCPQTKNLNDYKLIIRHNLAQNLTHTTPSEDWLAYDELIVDFVEWFQNQDFGRRFTISIRDILAWVDFINKCHSGVVSSSGKITPSDIYIHGACLVFLDALGSANISDSQAAEYSCMSFLHQQVGLPSAPSEGSANHIIDVGENHFCIGPFSIPLGNEDRALTTYTLHAPSTTSNCLRLLRGLQLHKPMLLEGSPGVGKTSLVTALARASGHHIVRINLSQQTDIADLFGADLPVEGGAAGQFSWRDGLFLQALKSGHWVVLDELNLASQSVLEGLNACFDHRAEVFVPELGKTFHIQHEKVKIFACQNPLKQGGGRQGLPQSFLNRFTQVYMNEMESADQEFISTSMYPHIPPVLVSQMVLIVRQMVDAGLPGEYNLRDIFRWCDLITRYQDVNSYNLQEHFSLLFIHNLRPSPLHCDRAYSIFEEVTGAQARHDQQTDRRFYLTDSHLVIGNMMMERRDSQPFYRNKYCILHKQLPALEALATCMDVGWMAILDGPECSGKSTVAHILSSLVGESLKVFSMNNAMDTTDLLGGFEQADVNRSLDRLCDTITSHLSACVTHLLPTATARCYKLIAHLYQLHNQSSFYQKLDVAESLVSLAQSSDSAPEHAVHSWKAELRSLKEKVSTSGLSTSGSFEWIDSVLVESVTKGHWLLIENAHICSASVLDRLNSLLEPNGSLTITERGVVDGEPVVIKPHANFRLILTTNMQNSDLSRAMKNRGVIISMMSPSLDEVMSSVDNSKLCDLIGVSQELKAVLRREHTELWSGRKQLGEQVLYERGRLCAIYHEKGFSREQSLHTSRRIYLYHCERQDVTSSLSTGTTSGEEGKRGEVWSVDSICRMPSLAMLEHLVSRIHMTLNQSTVEHTESHVISTGVRILLESASLHHLLHFIPQYTDRLSHIFTSRHQAQIIDIVEAARPLLALIKQVHSVSSCDQLSELPIDLRWLQEVWCKVSGDTRQLLSCLLNVWNTLILSSQMLNDLKSLPVNSWFNISSLVHRGEKDKKHLPHNVSFYYPRLAEDFSQLVYSITESEEACQQFTEQQLQQMLTVLELLRRFLSSSCIISSTLSWSWLRPAFSLLPASHREGKLSTTISHINTLLSEHNSESRLFNLVWKSFPHLPPIDCPPPLPITNQMQVEQSISSQIDKSQMVILLKKTLDSLCVYKKGGVEREELISRLSHMDVNRIVSTLATATATVHYGTHGDRLAEGMLELSALQAGSDKYSRCQPQPYVCTLWPVRELWLLRALLHSLSTDGGENLRLFDQLTALSSYCPSPGLFQMCVHLQLLSNHQSSKALLLSVMSEWFSCMVKSSAFRQGEPFIHSLHADQMTKVVPAFSSSSMFLIVSRLLSDPLSDKSSATKGGGASVSSSHSINPPVCVGKFKLKLNQLNDISRELWDYTALLSSGNVSSEEKGFQCLYEGLILDSDWIPGELRAHPHISSVANRLEELKLCQGDSTSEVKVAEKWVWLGLMQALSTSPRGVLDPVVKRLTELSFVKAEMSRIEKELSLRRAMVRAECSQEMSPTIAVHPYYVYLQSRLSSLTTTCEELEEGAVHRHRNEQFSALVGEAQALVSNTLNYSNLLEIVTGLQRSDNHRAIARETLTTASLESYISNIESCFPLYVDIYQGHVNAIKLVVYGLKRLSHCCAKTVSLSLGGTLSTPTQLFTSLSSTEGLHLLQETCELLQMDPSRITILCSQYLRLHTLSLTNEAYSCRNLDQTLLSKLSILMGHYVSMWQSDNAKRAEKEAEATSLYSFKQHGEEPETDEELIEKLTRLNFPSYQKEFSDLVQADTLGDSIEETAELHDTEDTCTPSITEQDMECVSRLHCNVLLSLAVTDWYRGQGHLCTHTERKKAHTNLLNILHEMITAGGAVGCRFDTSPSGELAHLHLISAGIMGGECLGKPISISDTSRTSSSNYDIYKDENVAEAVRCMEPLTTVKSRIEELLCEWPEHPLLLQIVSITERVKSFLVTDPLMKFTSGLELILEKLQEWETNAARHVSVQSAMNCVSQLVIEWRKLELDGWKQSLENVASKIRHKSTKYWFHLCSVLLPILNGDGEIEVPPVSDVVTSLISFMESSSLGDFIYRLRLLKAFTVHVGVVSTSANTQLMNSMYAIWKFYCQFEGRVEAHITKQRAGIEKELKNFVKISRWNDMNFWSVKASVDKAHKTLAKHMKSYHDILVTSACKLFTEDVSQLPSVSEVEDGERTDMTPTLTPTLTATPTSASISDLLSLTDTSSLHCLPRLSHLTTRFHSACDIISSKLTYFDGRAQAVEIFTREIIESVTDLQSLHIISGDEKEKQKKQARNIDMRKRKSLAMLLQTLHRIGLSYRKGSLKLQKCENKTDLLCSLVSPPLNLEVSLSTPTSNSSKAWVNLWTSSSNYMLRCITRRSVFLEASTKPSKELGVDIIQKLKGYSEHMIDLTRRHEYLISTHTSHWLQLRKQVLALHRFCTDAGESSEQVPLSMNIHSAAAQISSALPGITEHVEELKMLLLSAPSASETSSSSAPPSMTTSVSGLNIYSEKWQEIMSSIDCALSTLRNSCEWLSSMCTRPVHIYTFSELSLVVEKIAQLSACSQQLDSVLLHFRAETGELTLVSAHYSALHTFSQLLTQHMSSLTQPSQSLHHSLSTSNFTTAADDLVKDVLLACQHSITTLEKVPAIETEHVEALADGQLTDSLHLFSGAIRDVSLDKVVGRLRTLSADVADDVDFEARKYKVQILSHCLPILDLFSMCSQRLLIQSWASLKSCLKLLSILYNIFTHLASKGFCLPEELSDEMDGEGQGDFNTSEGAGLADGQGAKDVSDQIENEDDLDDAKRPEDREKEETTPETAPPQEDNAIEMSEDFEGAMEDAPTTEVDEEDENASSGDEDEMDDKMGDIGDSDLRDKLDDKLWGDDDKDDETENQEKKEEEEGKGSGESKQEMVAKDDNPEESGREEDKQESQADEEKQTEEQERDLNELEEKSGEQYDKEEKPDPYFNGDQDDKTAEGEESEFDLPDNLDLDEMEEKGGDEEPEAMDVDDEAEGSEGEESQEMNAEQMEEGEEESGEMEEEETSDVAQLEPEQKEESEKEIDENQQNVESYGASSQEVDNQMIEENAQDRGGETESKEEQGTGQSESSSQKEAGLGDSYQTGSADADDQNSQQADGQQKSAEEKRALADDDIQSSMQLDTIQTVNNKQAPAKQRQSQPPANSLYEHITADQQESADAEAMDAANEKELEEQQKTNSMDTEQLEKRAAEELPQKKQIKEAVELKAKEVSERLAKAKEKSGTDEDVAEDQQEVAPAEEEEGVEEEEMDNDMLNRESTIHTDVQLLHLSHHEVSILKENLEELVSEWGSQSNYEISESEARKAWEKYDAVTRSLSHELSEQLRLILEPTQAAKLRGDYRTGKRLNMRKVIAYIASQFRKDAIWLRRTEPSKREYQICMAVDDSSSMIDNHSKQLAFEALACISNALNYLQAGDMSIVSFGEDVKMVHDFSSRFSWDDGGNVLRNFSFKQKKTRIAHMLNTMCSKFERLRRGGSGGSGRHQQLAQLLMVVSDGRGLFLEGVDVVRQAVRRAINSGIFLVFVIIDNPHGKDSILDIKMPVFTGSGPPQIKSYMDSFPFPFYVILRDINSLPNTLGDALRQWFELVTSQSH